MPRGAVPKVEKGSELNLRKTRERFLEEVAFILRPEG
jgi:hypothetical protein